MKSVLIIGGILACFSTATSAQTLTAVRPLDGYSCARLNTTDAQMMDRKGPRIVIREAPNASAPVGTNAAGVVFVRTPAHVVGSFTEVLQLTGKPGWIETRSIKPFDPNARCTPSLMSNGRPGIG